MACQYRRWHIERAAQSGCHATPWNLGDPLWKSGTRMLCSKASCRRLCPDYVADTHVPFLAVGTSVAVRQESIVPRNVDNTIVQSMGCIGT